MRAPRGRPPRVPCSHGCSNRLKRVKSPQGWWTVTLPKWSNTSRTYRLASRVYRMGSASKISRNSAKDRTRRPARKRSSTRSAMARTCDAASRGSSMTTSLALTHLGSACHAGPGSRSVEGDVQLWLLDEALLGGTNAELEHPRNRRATLGGRREMNGHDAALRIALRPIACRLREDVLAGRVGA